MINNNLRVGNFTSSEIAALMKTGKAKDEFGAPALTYIEECKMERKLGRALNSEANARPMAWGKLLETRAFELLGLEYRLSSTDTIRHSFIPYWAGSPDGEKESAVIDIKCPITLKSFCELVDPLYNGLTGIEAMNAIRADHKQGDAFYWQLVSNSILTNKKFAELIVYMPYFSELQTIREMAEGNAKVYWVWSATDDELPYLVEGGYYKNLNIISFEVPEADKKLLEANILKAGRILFEDTDKPAVKVDASKIQLQKIA